MAKETKYTIPDVDELNRFITDYREEIIRYLTAHFSTYLKLEDFEDIFQDSCIALFENIKNGKLTELTCSLKSYLLTICINNTNKILERKVLVKGKPRLTPIAQSHDPEQPGIDENKIAQIIGTTEDDCDREECYHAIQQAVANFGEKCRKILTGFFYDNLNYKTMAELFGYGSADSVKTTAKRCRDDFRKKNQHILEICRN